MTLDDLQRKIAAGDALLVVGTGISKALSGNAPTADWLGLLQDGLTRIGKYPEVDSELHTTYEIMLDQAKRNSATSFLVTCASTIGDSIKDGSLQRYQNWLSEAIGGLEVKDSRLAKALAKLNTPILTTNYDTLLEKALGVPSVVWTDAEAMRETYSGEKKAIAHLHGIWDQPESVILTSADYARIMNDASSQHLQSAFLTSKSFIYVGFGAGLSDPNFSRLLNDNAALFKNSRAKHFRLCSNSDLEILTAAHADDNIEAIAYGDSHQELPLFLERLATTRNQLLSNTPASSLFARQLIVKNVRGNYLFTRQATDYNEREIDRLTIPPVLLRVPHNQSSAAQAAIEEDMEPIRVDATTVLDKKKLLIVAGDELSGVSTALQWLLADGSMKHSLAPLYVDAMAAKAPKQPLTALVLDAASAARLINEDSDPLPPYILAVDNMRPSSSRIQRAFIDNIKTIDAETILIGCREGDERGLFEALQGPGLEVEVVYLGRFGLPEIEALTGLVSSSDTSKVARTVAENLRKHRLHRTPLNICLLIVLVLDGDSLGPTSSETAILNKYVLRMIGADGPYVDPRLTISPQNREAVLAELARVMTVAKVGSLLYADALQAVAEYMRSVGWNEQPSATLTGLIETRILRIGAGDMVSFRQTSYLHLFAAKAGVMDTEGFYQDLLKDPLDYAPIIRHYSALVRSSEITLTTVRDLLISNVGKHEPGSRIFSQLELTDAPSDLSRRPSEKDVRDSATDQDDGEEEYYDDTPDDDTVPFPLKRNEDRPSWVYKTDLLDLASRVLRDSDQVRNSVLKDELFILVIRGWGELLDELSKQGVFDKAADFGANAMLEAGYFDESSLEDVREALSLLLPTFTIVGALYTCLVSTKLAVNAKNALAAPGFVEDVQGASASAIFSLALSLPGFGESLKKIGDRHGKKWFVGFVLAVLGERAYLNQDLSNEDEVALRKFIVQMTGGRHRFRDDAQRKEKLDAFDTKLRKERLLSSPKRLAEGETIIDRLGEKTSE